MPSRPTQIGPSTAFFTRKDAGSTVRFGPVLTLHLHSLQSARMSQIGSIQPVDSASLPLIPTILLLQGQVAQTLVTVDHGQAFLLSPQLR